MALSYPTAAIVKTTKTPTRTKTNVKKPNPSQVSKPGLGQLILKEQNE